MNILFHGAGSDHCPHVPATERLLTSQMKRMGFAGQRTSCIWASTDRDQAFDYARQRPEMLFAIEPLPGSVVTWTEQVQDMVLDFEGWLRDAAFHHDPRIRDQDRLQDVRGDIGIFEQYVLLGRKAFTVAAASAYLSDRSIKETSFSTPDRLWQYLCDHKGEVWVTGPYTRQSI